MTIEKLHTQGKTEEAKTDLQRLAKIRAERETAQAKRKAEIEGLCVSQAMVFLFWRPISNSFPLFGFPFPVDVAAKAQELEAKKQQLSRRKWRAFSAY